MNRGFSEVFYDDERDRWAVVDSHGNFITGFLTEKEAINYARYH